MNSHHSAVIDEFAPDLSLDPLLQTWFPASQLRTSEGVNRQIAWWSQGGADAAINHRFHPLLEYAARGELGHWRARPRSRLALILVLDQFPRARFRGMSRAFEQDLKAQTIAMEGLANGHYAMLASAWERAYYTLPLGHAEDLKLVQEAVALTDELVTAAPPAFRWWFVFVAAQAKSNRETIARFGRYPRRNAVLGRASTTEELKYMEGPQADAALDRDA